MSWKSKGAFTRLGNTFKRLHEKKLVFKEDFEALKNLQEEINELTEKRVNDHILFAKLLCSNINGYLMKYGDVNEAIKWVQMDLNIDLSSHLEQLTFELNLQTLKKLMESKGISFDLVTDKETKERELEIIKTNEKEFVSKILERWEYDDVKKSFEKKCDAFISLSFKTLPQETQGSPLSLNLIYVLKTF